MSHTWCQNLSLMFLKWSISRNIITISFFINRLFMSHTSLLLPYSFLKVFVSWSMIQFLMISCNLTVTKLSNIDWIAGYIVDKSKMLFLYLIYF